MVLEARISWRFRKRQIMPGFVALLHQNRNYRYTWIGQVVSEMGDYFNNVAVFALVMKTGGSGLVLSGVMLARAIPAVMVGPLAGIALDRLNRKHIMIASDLVRFVIALGFLLAIRNPAAWLLYLLSALLMLASPFFTAGRTSILPTITSDHELHTANSLTQTTQWGTVAVGAMLGGLVTEYFGFEWAFVFNALSFLASGALISLLRAERGGFRPKRTSVAGHDRVKPFSEYKEGLRYMWSVPIVFAIGMVSVGWATGGGAAQILFALFGDKVFGRGAEGIGTIWGFAGVGLVIGGPVGHYIGARASFKGYKRTIALAYALHGACYVAFAITPNYFAALGLVAMSRIGMAVGSVLNYSLLLRTVPDQFRGRVFSTIESMRWAMMMFSLSAAGYASAFWSPQMLGVVAGLLSSTTAVGWIWANWAGKLREPA